MVSSKIELFDGKVTVYGFPSKGLEVDEWATFIIKTNLGSPGENLQWYVYCFLKDPAAVVAYTETPAGNNWKTTGSGTGI